MNPNDKSSEITVQILLSLRSEDDAVHQITEKLRVREMGPADHIRTKHEVRTFVESGDSAIAESLLKRAEQRRELKQTVTMNETHARNLKI